jgi:hypothetical protein
MEQVTQQHCKWTAKNKTCSCSRPIYDLSGYCLFHKPNKEGADAKLFLKIINFNLFSVRIVELTKKVHSDLTSDQKEIISAEINSELNRLYLSNFSDEEKSRGDFQIYLKGIIELYHQSKISGTAQTSPDFRGFMFPAMEMPFKYVYNPFVMFPVLDFSDVFFEGPTNFAGFHFIGNVTFKNTVFHHWLIFANAIFDKQCHFIDTDLNTKYRLNGIDMFDNTEFVGSLVIFRNVKGQPTFNTTKFSSHTKLQLIDMHYSENYGEASFGENAYRVAKVQASAIGDYIQTGEYYYLERCYKGYQMLPPILFWDSNGKIIPQTLTLFRNIKIRKYHKYILPKVFDKMAQIIMGYGERPLRIASASFVIIGVFAEIIHLNTELNFLDSIFFSVISFTTLGIKSPDNMDSVLKMAFASESLIGTLLVALFILTLAKRYSRG